MREPVADLVDQDERPFFIGRNNAGLNRGVDLLREAEPEHRICPKRRDS